MKRTRYATLVAAAITCAAVITGCTPAIAEQPPVDSPRTEFRDISDYFAPRDPSGATRIAEEQAEKAAEAEREAVEAAEAPEPEYECQEAYYEPYSGPRSVSYTGDGFKQQGVREYNGMVETWYSSNAARHRDTDQWTVDDEGYYRDSDGYYVVATNNDDIAQGSVIETSKGEAKVYDGGCDSGIVDMYTAF